MSDYWEIFALKYAHRNNRTRQESFILDDDHASPHPMDYFVWLLRKGDQQILVDTGYEENEAEQRGRAILRNPANMLADFGVSPATIDTIILTHLHYDHAGGLKSYPNAHLHVQAVEMSYATGPCMCSEHLRFPFTGEHICDAVRALYEGRVTFAEGSRVIAPGVEVHLLGGHSRGLQVVRVLTQRGWVVLASDASHFYENYRLGKPFPIVVDLENMIRGYAHLRELADSDDHIIPGHDPLVLQSYPRVDDNDGNVVMLHAEPQRQTQI